MPAGGTATRPRTPATPTPAATPPVVPPSTAPAAETPPVVPPTAPVVPPPSSTSVRRPSTAEERIKALETTNREQYARNRRFMHVAGKQHGQVLGRLRNHDDRLDDHDARLEEHESALHGLANVVESIQNRMRRPSLTALVVMLVIGAIIGVVAGFGFASWDKLDNNGVAAVLGVCFWIIGSSIAYLVHDFLRR